MMKSWSVKCLAVRRVTQDNQGKKTAGVDGVKSLTPKQRLELVQKLRLSQKAKPTRRVWIPKPGTEEKRPLGIPTMTDRALQALVKLALEPEWEAKFEPNSFGFRPGRSCQDAIVQIFLDIRFKPKFVLDADISKCFDRINHKALLEKLQTSPTLHRQIRAWLKAGVMDGKQLFPTSEGTPQGGVLSPLLANIALHGLENEIKQVVKKGRDTQKELSLIRYADDFVVLHKDLSVVQRCQQVIVEWLKGMSLELKPSKTQITHTLNEYEGKTGFDFLGFTIRQFPVGKYVTGKNTHGEPLGFATIITPSKEKLKQHIEQVGQTVRKLSAVTQSELIGCLNPIIRGWANYYACACSRDAYEGANHYIYQQLRSWAYRRHPNKSRDWIFRKYWRTIGNSTWTFASKESGQLKQLFKHTDTPIVRHTKVQGNRSPYDGDWVYWGSRLGKHPEVPTRLTTLLKRQKGKCNWCKLYFKDGDLMETDHKDPSKPKGERGKLENLQVLHRHCHDTKTALDKTMLESLSDNVLSH
jgi:RNA-directed DNA polymerase